MMSRVFHVLFDLTCLYAVSAGALRCDTLYVTNELPNSRSPVSSVSSYDLASQTFLDNLVPSTPYDLPDAITVDPSGNIFVADAGADRVVEFNSAHNQIAVYPTMTGSQVSPTGLAVDPGGSVYASVLNGTIQKISGGTVTTIGSVPEAARGIAYDSYDGLLYITTQTNGDIYSLPVTGGPATLFASHVGSGNLRGLAFETGNLYVSDTTYSHDQGAIYEFPGGSPVPVTFATGLQGPNYIATDGLGNLYVAEYFGNDVVKITPAGADLGSYISGLAGPSGIAIGPSFVASPEPATLGLVFFALLGLAAVNRKTRSRSLHP